MKNQSVTQHCSCDIVVAKQDGLPKCSGEDVLVADDGVLGFENRSRLTSTGVDSDEVRTSLCLLLFQIQCVFKSQLLLRWTIISSYHFCNINSGHSDDATCFCKYICVTRKTGEWLPNYKIVCFSVRLCQFADSHQDNNFVSTHKPKRRQCKCKQSD